MAETAPREQPASVAALEADRMGQAVQRKAQRKLKARRAADRGAWFWLGMFGLVGWSVAAPTLLGILTGLWLDRTWPGRTSWTLTLLLLGVVLGCANAWYWVKREQRQEPADE